MEKINQSENTTQFQSGSETQDQRINNPNLEQILGQAEETLRRGIQTLSDWSDQARDVFENRPGVVLASVSIAGFMTGLLLRKGGPVFERGRGGFSADPLIVFLTGAFAGFTLGPRVLREISQSAELSGTAATGATIRSFDRAGAAERTGSSAPTP